MLLQTHTVDKATFHLNQSHSSQYEVYDTADDILHIKKKKQKANSILLASNAEQDFKRAFTFSFDVPYIINDE